MAEDEDSYPSSSSSSEFEDEEELCRTLSLKPLQEGLMPLGMVVPRPKTSRGRTRNWVDEEDDDDAFYPPAPGENVEVPMEIDTHEHLWSRTRDVFLRGCVIEYAGPGLGDADNGFAQSEIRLSPLNHYFEVTILDPGDMCYIAVGVARKDYPINKHPGWNSGSVAFHADDGKIFIGSGIGSPFGPRCEVNDVLGCGIIFPINHCDPSLEDIANHGDGDDPLWPWEARAQPREMELLLRNQAMQILREEIREELFGAEIPWVNPGGEVRWVDPEHEDERYVRGDQNRPEEDEEEEGDLNESEDEVWWKNTNLVHDEQVKIFFRLNGKLLGVKEVRIPRGGFYPTIGMMGPREKISVDLFPLTG